MSNGITANVRESHLLDAAPFSLDALVGDEPCPIGKENDSANALVQPRQAAVGTRYQSQTFGHFEAALLREGVNPNPGRPYATRRYAAEI